MNGILALVKKEMSHYFFAPMAYIILGSFLLINGFIFYVVLAALSRAASPPVSPMAVLFGGTFFFWLQALVVPPVITMRLGAEERKSGTIETLLTAPLSDLQIVLGKFLSAFMFYSSAWLLTSVYAVILKSYGDVDTGPILSGYLGTLLLGMFFVSVGTFTTMVSRNQVVAAILAFSILAMMAGFTLFPFILGGGLREFFSFIDLLSMMESFSSGQVDTRNVVYLVSGTLFFLAVSVKALEARRWQ